MEGKVSSLDAPLVKHPDKQQELRTTDSDNNGDEEQHENFLNRSILPWQQEESTDEFSTSPSSRTFCRQWLENQGFIFGDDALEDEFHSVALHSNVQAIIGGVTVGIWAIVIAYSAATEYNINRQKEAASDWHVHCMQGSLSGFGVGTLILAVAFFASICVKEARCRTWVVIVATFIFCLGTTLNIAHSVCEQTFHSRLVIGMDNLLINTSLKIDPPDHLCQHADINFSVNAATSDYHCSVLKYSEAQCTLFGNLTTLNRLFGFASAANIDFIMVVVVATQVVSVINLLPVRWMLLFLCIQSLIILSEASQFFTSNSLMNFNDSLGDALGCSGFLITAVLSCSFQLLIAFIASSVAIMFVVIGRMRAMRELFFWTKKLDVRINIH